VSPIEGRTPWYCASILKIAIYLAPTWRLTMSLGTLLLIILVLMLIGVLPSWPHSRNWGYFPSGILGFLLIIVIILFLTGRM
jgi:hypothetical protein